MALSSGFDANGSFSPKGNGPSITAINFGQATGGGEAAATLSSFGAATLGQRELIQTQGCVRPKMTFGRAPQRRGLKTRTGVVSPDIGGASLGLADIRGSLGLGSAGFAGFATSRASAADNAADISVDFDTAQFRSSLYSRDVHNKRPFFIEQMRKESLIKTNKTHKLQAQQHNQTYQTARGIIQPTTRAGDYILDRFNSNQRLYERAKRVRRAR